MNGQKNIFAPAGSEYHEESIRPVAAILILVLLAIALPLGWFIKTTRDAGLNTTDMNPYSILADEVKRDIAAIRNKLDASTVEVTLLNGVSSAPSVTLIAPKIIHTNAQPEELKDPKNLDVQLKAIYWNPTAPIVTIDDENYRIGERINGFTIVEIRKQSVIFKSPLGETVVKYFYESLNDTLRNR